MSFIAINPEGVASPVVSRAFTKLIPYDDAVTADAIEHFIAGRIDVNEYLAYSDQFGFFTPFTLYLVVSYLRNTADSRRSSLVRGSWL